MRIGLYLDSYALAGSPDVVAAIEATARLCESLGHEIIETEQIIDQEEYEFHYRALYSGIFYDTRQAIEEATGQPIAESGLMNNFTVSFGNFREGLGPDDYEAAEAYFSALDQRHRSWLTPFDVVLTPVTYAPPPRLGYLFDESEDYAVTSRRVFDFVSFMSPMNVLGLPGMSVPLHFSADGLPIGSHFFGKYGQEATLLELAYELEAAQPWAQYWAPNSIANLS